MDFVFPERRFKVGSFDEVILPAPYHLFEPCFGVNVSFSARRSECCTTVVEEFTPEFTAFLPALMDDYAKDGGPGAV